MVLVAALAVAAALVPPSVSAAGSKCSYPTLTTPFTAWSDTASYTLVPGGSFEAPNASWSLAGARIVLGNEPFYVRGKGDKKSLSIPDLSTATTPTMCVSAATPSIRFFATNDGDAAAPLTVDVGVVTRTITWSRLATIVAPAPGWAPSDATLLNLPDSLFAGTGSAKVVLRFTAQGGGAGGAWRIDDLYLDPFKRV